MKFNIKSNFEEIIASLFFCFTLILVLVNIIMRYFLKTGIPWSEEVATGCFVWTVFIGAAAAFKENQHIGIDILVKYLSDDKKHLVKLFVDVLLVIVIAFITVLSIQYIFTSYTKPTPVLGVSSAYISSAIPVGFILMLMRSIQFLINDLKIVKEKELSN